MSKKTRKQLEEQLEKLKVKRQLTDAWLASYEAGTLDVSTERALAKRKEAGHLKLQVIDLELKLELEQNRTRKWRHLRVRPRHNGGYEVQVSRRDRTWEWKRRNSYIVRTGSPSEKRINHLLDIAKLQPDCVSATLIAGQITTAIILAPWDDPLIGNKK